MNVTVAELQEPQCATPPAQSGTPATNPSCPDIARPGTRPNCEKEICCCWDPLAGLLSETQRIALYKNSQGRHVAADNMPLIKGAALMRESSRIRVLTLRKRRRIFYCKRGDVAAGLEHPRPSRLRQIQLCHKFSRSETIGRFAIQPQVTPPN